MTFLHNFYYSIKKYLFTTMILVISLNIFASELENNLDNEEKFPQVSDLIPSPGRINKLVATYSTELNKTIELYEFDVFGIAKYDVKSKKLTKQQRFNKIKDKIFDKILVIEGKKTDIDKSLSYKNNHDDMLDKNSVIYFYDMRIVGKFVTDKMIETEYNSNRKKFLLDFESEKKNVKKLLVSQNSKKISDYAKFFMDSLRTSYKVYYNDSLYNEMLNRFNFNSKQKLIDSVKSLRGNQTLARYNKIDLKASYLASRIENVKPMNIPFLKQRKNALRNLTDGLIINELLTLEARKAGMHEINKVKIQSDMDMESYIGTTYKKRMFSENKFFPSGIEVENYYIDNKYKDESFKSKHKMQVYEIIMFYENDDEDSENDKIKVYSKMEELRQKILESKDELEFEKYSKFYNRPHSRDGFLGWIFKTDLSMIGETAFNMHEGEISDLIVQKKAISMLKVVKVQKPMVYAIKYVEEIIKQKLMKENRRNYKEKTIRDLFGKYEVKIID